MKRLLYTLVAFTMTTLAQAAEPWSTYRGNGQRTGSTDNKPGPATPKVLWVYKAAEHFVAAPVPAGDRLLVSGLGAFNVSVLRALDIDPAARDRVVWSKSSPYLKLPSVSSPALIDGKIIFGDGMHQNDGGVLHCLRADKGSPLWQAVVPGNLVHMEGSPTIADGRVVLGGGSAGVLCVDLGRVTLDGKEMTLAEIQKLLDGKMAELRKKYEDDKKTNPQFAIPPSDDQLPRPAPMVLWQQGKDKWHVDAPVAVAGDLVLASSAYLDKEKLGERALFALDARTGAIKWQSPLTLNPWGGPTVSGDTVIVTGSNVGFYFNELKGAKGDVVALDLATGKQKWRKEIPVGGAVACAAVMGDTVVVTATDGKVRAFALADGERRWIYDAKAPFFAAPAVSGGIVYVGDLKGAVHALDLADGTLKWKLDLATDPAVKAPGMIYGGPVVQAGRVYVATCNLEGPGARQPTVVVCIGDK